MIFHITFKIFTCIGSLSKKFTENRSLFIGLVKSKDSSHWINDLNITGFFYLKGIITNLLKNLGFDSYIFDSLNSDFFSEGLSISLDNKEIGNFGLVNKNIRSSFGIEEEVYATIINIDLLEKFNFINKFKIKEISKFPNIQRDFSILIDKEVSFKSIVDLSNKTEKNILKSIELFDVYEGEKIPNDKKSYGIRFTFLDNRKTLTDNYVDRIMNKLKIQFENKFNAQLR